MIFFFPFNKFVTFSASFTWLSSNWHQNLQSAEIKKHFHPFELIYLQFMIILRASLHQINVNGFLDVVVERVLSLINDNFRIIYKGSIKFIFKA